MPTRKQRKAGRTVNRTLADGSTKTYRYAAYRPKQPKIAADSIEALIRAYRRSPEWVALAPRSQELYAIYLRPLEEIGHLPVRALKRRELLIIRDGIAAGRGNGAATAFIQTAGALFTWAVDHDWIEHSPVHKIRKLPGGHLRAWTRLEADAAQAGLPEHLRRVIVLARYTGQRRGDLCAMAWTAYDGQSIRLVQQKTGVPLVLPCHPALKAELDAWRMSIFAPSWDGEKIDMPSLTILTSANGRPWKPAYLSVALPAALAAIGLPDDLNVHGLRKLAAAEMAEAGCSAHEIAAITGHKTLAMVSLYTRSADQERLAGAAVVKLVARTNRNNR